MDVGTVGDTRSLLRTTPLQGKQTTATRQRLEKELLVMIAANSADTAAIALVDEEFGSPALEASARLFPRKFPSPPPSSLVAPAGLQPPSCLTPTAMATTTPVRSGIKRAVSSSASATPGRPVSPLSSHLVKADVSSGSTVEANERMSRILSALYDQDTGGREGRKETRKTQEQQLDKEQSNTLAKALRETPDAVDPNNEKEIARLFSEINKIRTRSVVPPGQLAASKARSFARLAAQRPGSLSKGRSHTAGSGGRASPPASPKNTGTPPPPQQQQPTRHNRRPGSPSNLTSSTRSGSSSLSEHSSDDDAFIRKAEAQARRQAEAGDGSVTYGSFVRVSRREQRVTERNIREINMIRQMLTGHIDYEAELKKKSQVRDAKIKMVQQRKLGQYHVETVRRAEVSELKEAVREVKKSKVDNIEEYIIRICTWMVTINVIRAGEIFNRIANDEVRHLQQRRMHWAAKVLTRSLPPLWRKYQRRRRLIKFGALVRIALFVTRYSRRHLNQSISIIYKFLIMLRNDPMLKMKSFGHKVRTATRIARSYFVTRLHQFRLLQRQWDTMETMLLLCQPGLAVPQADLARTTGLSSYNNGIEYDALPSFLRAQKTDAYHVFMGKWKWYCKEQGVTEILPASLQKYRTMPQIRDATLRESFNRRNKNHFRAVKQLFMQFVSEKRSAKDMMEAAQRLRHATAIEDAEELYPTVMPGTRMFDLLVEFEEEYSSSPFFEVMVANHREVINAKMPKVPHCRVLLKSNDLAKMVRKGLEQSRLTRTLQKTGSSAAEAIGAGM